VVVTSKKLDSRSWRRADGSLEHRVDRDALGDAEETFGNEAMDNYFPRRAFCNEGTKFGDTSVDRA
jgi:hypothetical protein